MSKYIIGIDPGLTGAIATSTGEVWDIPVVAKGKGTSAVKNHVDPVGVAHILGEFMHGCSMVPDYEVVVYLEQQYYRKKVNPKTKQEIPQGGSSIFSLGDTYGVLRTIPALYRFRLVTVMPSVWKTKLKLTHDKEVCRARALELFPAASITRKKDHNRAEALLLAYYGELCETGRIK